jgi:hypothetical protein
MSKPRLLMFDGCCGLKGASQVMSIRGWKVITLDNDPQFEPDIMADIREYHYAGERPDLMWFSPPCDEFAREWMPWCKTGRDPDLSIVLACKRIIDESNPCYWVIENVKGAVKWLDPHLGRPRAIIGPFYLWGYFPPLGAIKLNGRKKESMSSSWKAERAKIPVEISLALTLAIERQPELLESLP